MPFYLRYRPNESVSIHLRVLESSGRVIGDIAPIEAFDINFWTSRYDYRRITPAGNADTQVPTS